MTTKYEATNIVGCEENVQKRKAKTPAFIYVLTFLSTIGGFLFGYDTGVVSGAMILIRDEFRLNTTWHEAIVSVTIGAAWMFALIGGWLTGCGKTCLSSRNNYLPLSYREASQTV